MSEPNRKRRTRAPIATGRVQTGPVPTGPTLVGPILIGVGANLPHPIHGAPLRTCQAALEALAASGVKLLARSPWYRTAPVPASDQPDFVNGVVEVATRLDPAELLSLLHRIEADFGRVRGRPNAARTLDLDLLAYGATIREGPDGPILPHPRLHERAFVLLPLRDVAPGWRHPKLGKRVADLIAALPPGQSCRQLE
jgi:2-amino-4-hydroxy-6-hydroxymethyldihydropteridine diphosphokinase